MAEEDKVICTFSTFSSVTATFPGIPSINQLAKTLYIQCLNIPDCANAHNCRNVRCGFGQPDLSLECSTLLGGPNDAQEELSFDR